MVRAHDTVEDLIAISAAESDAVLGGIWREASLRTECALNEQRHRSLNYILYLVGQCVEPKSVYVVELN